MINVISLVGFRRLIYMVIYRLTLDFIYIYSISPLFNYDGYTIDFTFSRYFFSWSFFLLSYFFAKKIFEKKEISSLFTLILYLLYFIPGTSLYGLNNIDSLYFLFNFISFSVLIFLSLKFKVKKVKVKSILLSSRLYTSILVLLSLVNMFVMGYYGGFNLHFDLLDVYELRAAQSEIEMPGIIGYIQPLFAHLIPIFITYSLIQKKYLLFGLLCLSQLVSFSFGGSKYAFFAVFVAIGSVFFYNYRKRFHLVYVLVGLNILALIETFFIPTTFPIISTFFHRRMCYVPNKLSSLYYDFFSQNPLLYLRESVLRWLGFSSPYNVRTPLLIGREYYNRDMGANTGMFGEAFSQFGWGSIFIYPFLYIFIFKIAESCFDKINPKIAFTFVVLYSLSFIDGSFWSVLLTQGFLFVCFFYLYIRTLKKL